MSAWFPTKNILSRGLIHTNRKPIVPYVVNKKHRQLRGMLHWWPFTEYRGARIADVFGSARGAVQNNAVWDISASVDKAGQVRKSLYFDGNASTGAYVELPDTVNCGTAGTTIMLWYLHKGGTYDQRLISKADGGGTPNHYFMVSRYSGFDAPPLARLRLRLKVDGTTDTFLSSDVVCAPGDTWYHIAFTYSIADNTMRFYFFGEPNGTQTHSVSTPTTITQSDTVGVEIGRNPDAYGEHEGLIDDVRIYNRALSRSEILNIIHHPYVSLVPIGASHFPIGTGAGPIFRPKFSPLSGPFSGPFGGPI